tara:strand:+ start:4734 stop:5510 length:777 start_codon:yes stop_codon:yes gene_type:complete
MTKEISDLKGIVLAGGAGTRLHPLTKVTSKQLLPIYNKPMIYFPLSTLINIGIKEILLISTPIDLKNFQALLGDGSQWNVKISYEVQEKPNGIAESLVIAEDYIDDCDCILILGDNLFYGPNIKDLIVDAYKANIGATIFGHKVPDPERYGVIEFQDKKVISLEEKPNNPKSSWVATGLYIYDKRASQFAKKLKPSKRNEIEITDLNNTYLKEDKLNVQFLDSDNYWLDTGTFDALLEASNFVRNIEKKTGNKISDLD